ncbi:hypothetical protein JTE90_014904 [Oedothorax gibbosus]|uniref:Zinc finger MYND domain-containing protein 11 n=1 Tax=Oedothorax gibbosus TaxID=931172 RepID=A0AAV6VLE9_9ARAC|nr:hypothetical protein JTE90_014904 [Oedothorax gibbosus]
MAVKRRQGCPQTALHMWDAIAYIRQQKQIPNVDRLSGYMKRVYNLNPPDFERQLKFAVSDELVVLKKSVGCKGAKVGIEQDGYRIPDEEQERDGHDWYCFECHRGGEVILCSTCHRVYHELCVSDDSETFVCPVCKENPEKFIATFKKSELNTLLSFTCIRLKEKTRELHRIPHPDDEKWRYTYLIYEPMDLITMEDKMKNCEYVSLAEFYTDAQQIVHNVSVYFGMQSTIAEMARQMLIDCEYDLAEIVRCANCYKMSNSKNNKLWFCQPCDPPHELVYAKLRGYPYWPAKIIKKYDTWYDVRFFGAKHQRGQIDLGFVKPISTSYKKLGVKKTASFDRAYNELRHHMRLVEEASKKDPSAKNQSPTKILEEVNGVAMQDSPKLKNGPGRKRKSTTTPAAAKAPSAKKPVTVPVKKNKKFYQESPTSSSPKNNPEDAVILEDHNFVSSSSQETVSHSSIGVQTDKELTGDLEAEKQKSVSAAVDKLKREHKEAQRKAEESRKEAHELQVVKMIEQHRLEISETKKKQWCYNCESEAIYHCCWNTSYCSVECQQVHWHKEHKRTCRRKR